MLTAARPGAAVRATIAAALVAALATGCGREATAVTVPEALGTDGEVLVEGYLFADPGGMRLCEAVAESFPPQCGGASLVVEGATPDDFRGLRSEGDQHWSDTQRRVRGTVRGDTISVTDPGS